MIHTDHRLIWKNLGRHLHRFWRTGEPWDNQNPIREELFSVERIEQHARSLAAAHSVTDRPKRVYPLARRLRDNGVVLLEAYRSMVEAIDEGRAMTPASEWLIDNYHLVEKQVREISSDLPPSYYRELPKLAGGPFAGYPRVFGIAWGFIAHTDSSFDTEMLVRYVRAYQEVQPLKIGELWAVSITLRIVIIENLRRIAQMTVENRAARQQADRLADRILGLGGRLAEPVSMVLADYERARLSDAFAVQLVRRLRDQDPRIAPALSWLDQKLATHGTTADTVVRNVHRRQGASNVTVRNIITSLRLISDVDWNDIFEEISLVNDVLATGIAFKEMDFPTRNLYRSAIEELARGSARTELDIAHDAVLAAKRLPVSDLKNPDTRENDPGYHLLGGGRPAFEVAIGFRPPLRQWPARLNRAFGIAGYASAIAVVTTILVVLPLIALGGMGLGLFYLLVLAILGAIPAIDSAVALVNRAVTTGFGPTLLPAWELRNGVPSHLRTLIAVPTMLTSETGIEEQIERLEIHHLASPDGDLYFALLSDWADAATERVDGDDTLLATAAAGIGRLNRRYGPGQSGPRFLLLHRKRVWNDSERRWIGWERKRGKLHELNRLLRGATDTSFMEIAGLPLKVPTEVRYVVTLDSDTQLPRDAVRRLIGKMAHPLNRPRFDASAGRVVEGYAVLQPRVTLSLPLDREAPLFQRLFSSLSGIDPYASTVSDVYQDLFGEGSYTGKGIYDIDAFEAALADRVPDSTLLSHDLFEGVFARSGLASDVEVVEEFPARYDVAALRHHRWARGDWQLLPWILGNGPDIPGSKRKFGPIPAIGRWKMVDNLRRTLTAPAAILALLVGWSLPFESALLWTGFVLLTIILPTLFPVIAAIRPYRPGVTIVSHLRALGSDFRLGVTLAALIVVFLAHQAWLMGDAIVRTLWRLYVSRHHLLEWVPASLLASSLRLNTWGFYRRMAGALVIALVAIAVAEGAGQRGWSLVLPFALLWLISPAVARWVSLSPRREGRLPVSVAEAQYLRLTARRTWRFFESFVTPLDHMLPPDNFQEDPDPVLAHRTSPTNIGLYLLSVVCARDFGWIGTNESVDRLEATLATMAKMERVRGHYFNWYDTTDLRPLDPRYISSVDSGNLAGHLIALANACQEWRTDAFDASKRLAGVADAVDLTRDEVARMHDGRRTQTVTWLQLDDALEGLASAVRLAAENRDGSVHQLDALVSPAETMVDIAHALAIERGDDIGADLLFWAKASLNSINSHRRDLGAQKRSWEALIGRLKLLEDNARTIALGTEFGFLLDRERRLLSIGYQVSEATLDSNCYDLLASEARLASFFAIAKGDVPARHWFRLSRAVTPVGHSAALISWSGSMFEYLMPALVMRAPTDSLLEQTSRLVVRSQIEYGAALRLPWGISESAYNARDIEFTYQYSNFGIPHLGLKRGLAENFVVAPYATALATMVDPRAACANLSRLAQAGARGRYGFYEALDFTPSRVPEGESVTIVRAFMAHHQGMSIVAIADALLGGAMKTRFHAEPIIQATELLLQERMPRDVSVAQSWAADVKSAAIARDLEPSGGRRFGSAYQATPATQLLSNGRFVTMITAAGSGYSRWGDIALTRWREDATCDDSGSYIFLRDVRSGEVWSAGFQPSGTEYGEYIVSFYEDRAEFARQDGSLRTMMDVIVSSEDDAEVRRVSITNTGIRNRELEITSYAELVLAPQNADISHPAFSKLFVETEYLPNVGALVATRRKRDHAEPDVWAAHLAVISSDTVGRIEFETDRARFLGRGHGIRSPIAVIDGRSLSNTVGYVLDPIFALRRRIRLVPGATVRIAFWTLVASSREILLGSIDKHRDTTAFNRAATLAWTQTQVECHHLGITVGEAGLFQRLAGHLIYASPTLRPSSDTIRRGGAAPSGLWGQGISGDLPILLLRIADTENLDIARELLQAHEYWLMKHFNVDLVILNEHQSSYIQDLQIALEGLVRANQPRRPLAGDNRTGRVFILRADLIPATTQALLYSVARVVMVAQRGSLLDQLERIAGARMPARPTSKRTPPTPRAQLATAKPNLEYFNGLGGFADGGKEYVTILGPGQSTPAPWINVIANPEFGFQVATEGAGYTWSINSRENQLTPWSNDPVTDRSGEAFYLRDDDTGDLWSPTALPIRDDTAIYVARHGWGYSRFEHSANGIVTELTQFVPLDAPIKISRLVIQNRSNRLRYLSVTAYVEWVLGPSRSVSLPHVTTEIDPGTGAMFSRNPWNAEFGSRVGFIDLRGAQTDWTGDRREFIGRNGTLANPAALASAASFSNHVGAGLDPCGAMRTRIELTAHGRVEVVCFLGQAVSAEEARRLIAHYRTADLDAERVAVARSWNQILGMVQVKTPDRSMDIMLNGWLLYQTLVCRVWARSAFYQSSGAYGFRDQLQDNMALVMWRPDLTRAHLLRAAGRQFIVGDVQHWWLPHSGRGVRTRISDDRVWLAYAVNHYISATKDTGILDEMVPFLEGHLLKPEEHDSFFNPELSDQSATLFEHCARALDQSLGLGGHGLPLIGTGDWNDGMNRVGERGQGESVWLAWILYATLASFAPIAEARHETVRAALWRTHMEGLKASLEREAWDGEWYRRGFFDDGTPLGAANSESCRIDSIAQSWAVLSGAADPSRAALAMAAVERELIRPEDQLALLFTPPFDKTALDPGYIKSYPPGIRENGGQYTHAALWTVMAFAAMGEGDKAAGLFHLLNPINHARTRADVHSYKVEPFVVAADVYSVAPHVGRGGWTWYTGSAGWMQRAGLESILGVRKQADQLLIDPCIPRHWDGFELSFQHGTTHYDIRVSNPDQIGRGIAYAALDQTEIAERPLRIRLNDDGATHRLEVRLGNPDSAPAHPAPELAVVIG